MRLIDADELKKDIMSYKTMPEIRKAISEVIDDAPTVEITEEQAIDKLHETGWIIRHDKEMTERPQGEWIGKEEYDDYPYKTVCECSECGKMITVSHNDFPNFCPNCGADMREDSDK